MDNIAVWALGGAGLLGFAAYAAAPGSDGKVLVEATKARAIAALDGHSEDVFGTGLGGLRISSQRLTGDKARVDIRRINTEHEISCHVTITPADETHVTLETDCLAPVSDEEPNKRRDAALKIITPVAREFAVAAIEERKYETSGVVDDMMAGIHDREIGVRGDLGY
ncbi:hypothetical protein K3152_03755 [Qipengyuania sp. 1NDH17]|uniref:Uncharacterized protein n=1 Tax=Qipengyuania polymorpha TaxID=2867234 RepID=A0ABS7IV78_9SPHN|nr:hypothetical protein [Qipengyuania polymorpha]MBX7457353.1 hypothetical protein [Qipengyuania polymorpha]